MMVRELMDKLVFGNHSTTDDLVNLQVLIEKSHLEGKGLHYCFVDFKKAFDMVPHEHLSR